MMPLTSLWTMPKVLWMVATPLFLLQVVFRKNPVWRSRLLMAASLFLGVGSALYFIFQTGPKP
jgi:hypothetical protein